MCSQSVDGSRLQRLPAELRVKILASLPDFDSLQNAVLASKTLYYTFLSDKASILRGVVEAHVGPGLLHDAAAVRRSAQEQTKEWTKDSAREFIADYLERGQRMSLEIDSMQDAAAITEFYDLVRRWVDRFFEHISNKVPSTSERSVSDRTRGFLPSTKEKLRTFKAMYRYEICCNLFGYTTDPVLDMPEQIAYFFLKCAPWEIEQLGCVYDYLRFHLVRPAFDYLAVNNRVWISWHVDFHSALDMDMFYESALSQGLRDLECFCDVNLASSVGDTLAGGPKAQHPRFAFLGYSLSEGSAYSASGFNNHLTGAGCSASAYRAQLDDFDSGPEDVWRSSNYPEANAPYVPFYQDVNRCSRQWGYVFWDRSRLDRWAILDDDWELVESKISCPAPEDDRSFQEEAEQAYKLIPVHLRGWRVTR